jgi:hypothetical protein
LKKKEENYKIKLFNLEKKEIKDQQIHDDRKKMKSQLEKKRNEKNIELERKKEKIKNLKNAEHNMLKETKDKNIYMKRQRYQSALNDKKILKNIRQEIEKQQNNKNCFRHAKVKQEYYEGKTNKLKKNFEKQNEDFIEQENDLKRLKIIEDKMIKTYNKLEMIEKECIENLYKSQCLNEKIKEKNNLNITNNFKKEKEKKTKGKK